MNSETSLKNRLEWEIADRLFQKNTKARPYVGYPLYVADLEQILVPGVQKDAFEGDLAQGAGSELESQGVMPPKFQAARSSSALVVNTFGYYKKLPSELSCFGIDGFDDFCFEAKCPTGISVPHLDLLLTRGRDVFAVESKFLEPLERKEAKFAESYGSVVDKLADSQWKDVYQLLKRNSRHYQSLDAAQLVKHYLGLRNSFPNTDVNFFYLYWEPINSSEIPLFVRHASEVSDLVQRVEASHIPLKAITYRDVWLHLESTNPKHVDNLRSRYEINA